MQSSLTGMTMDQTAQEVTLHTSVAGGPVKYDSGEESMLDDGLSALLGTLTVTFNEGTRKRSVKYVERMDRTIVEHSDLSMVVEKKLLRAAEEMDPTIMEHCDKFIPGIPDTLTMHEIVPRLQWRDFHNLAMVNHKWNEAIRSREVHDVRVKSHSTETLVVMQSGFNVFLVSIENRYFYRLPEVPIPDLSVEYGLNSLRWVSFDGKIYVLGGLKEDDSKGCASRKVYVMDLAGQRKWKRCASMKSKRNEFACGVLDGNIYVFGGSSHMVEVEKAEVYDLKGNFWSSISYETWRESPTIATIGVEFVFYGGYDDRADYLDAYNPSKDEWRTGPKILEKYDALSQKTFVAQGKLHKFYGSGIYVYNDSSKGNWSHVHSVSNDLIVRAIADDEVLKLDGVRFHIEDIVTVDNEILVALQCRDWTNYDRNAYRYSRPPTSHLFFRSQGLGRNQEEIVWHREDGYLPPSDLKNSDFGFLCTIHL